MNIYNKKKINIQIKKRVQKKKIKINKKQIVSKKSNYFIKVELVDVKAYLHFLMSRVYLCCSNSILTFCVCIKSKSRA